MNAYLYDILCTKAIDFFSYVRMYVAFIDENVEILIKECFNFYDYANQEIYDDMLNNYMSIISSYKEEENQTEQEMMSMSNTYSNIADLYLKKQIMKKLWNGSGKRCSLMKRYWVRSI